LDYEQCPLTRRGGDVSQDSYIVALFCWKGIWTVKSWKFIPLGLHDVEGGALDVLLRQEGQSQICDDMG